MTHRTRRYSTRQGFPNRSTCNCRKPVTPASLYDYAFRKGLVCSAPAFLAEMFGAFHLSPCFQAFCNFFFFSISAREICPWEPGGKIADQLKVFWFRCDIWFSRVDFLFFKWSSNFSFQLVAFLNCKIELFGRLLSN